MKIVNNQDSKFKDYFIYFIIFALTFLVFFINYYLHLDNYIKLSAWVGWIIISSLIFYFTTSGQKLKIFIKDAIIELKQIIWPTRQESIQITSIVVIMVTVMGFILWGIDAGMMWIISKLTNLG